MRGGRDRAAPRATFERIDALSHLDDYACCMSGFDVRVRGSSAHADGRGPGRYLRGRDARYSPSLWLWRSECLAERPAHEPAARGLAVRVHRGVRASRRKPDPPVGTADRRPALLHLDIRAARARARAAFGDAYRSPIPISARRRRVVASGRALRATGSVTPRCSPTSRAAPSRRQPLCRVFHDAICCSIAFARFSIRPSTVRRVPIANSSRLPSWCRPSLW